MPEAVLAIDPGPVESAYVLWRPSGELRADKLSNAEVLARIEQYAPLVDVAAIEMIASYGMAVGAEVFETCVWIGRFYACAEQHKAKDIRLIRRLAVKLHHCQTAKAKDSNIRQALIDKYGAPGTKKNPGTTYGLAGDTWQAFALATCLTEPSDGREIR